MTITEEIRQQPDMKKGQQISIAWRLSLPIIIAQLTNIAMQYIDAAMVGQLGADASASVGLVSSTIWLFGGVTYAAVYGFSVQVAHAVGAGRTDRSRSIFRQGLKVTLLYACLMAVLSASIAGVLPRWLGGEERLRSDATAYFLTISLCLPINQLRFYAGGCLETSGNTKTPGILSVLLCVLNVILNALLIPERITWHLGVLTIDRPGAGLGVFGAALATALADLIIALAMLYVAACRQEELQIRRCEKAPIEKGCMQRAVRIALPAIWESAAISGAQVASTRIVAPLGAVSIASNSFAVTAESLCYMPGYGLEGSAQALVGQSLGSGNVKLARSFAWITTIMGMTIMSVMGVIMYFVCPGLMAFMTPDLSVRALAVQVLRIELLAEPFFGASIVAAGAMRGAGDTMVPSIMNMVSIWGVRITLSLLMVGRFGLTGAWIAMCVELCFRGIIFLIRLASGRWLKHFHKPA